MKLSPQAVEQLFVKCLTDEPNGVIIEGVVLTCRVDVTGKEASIQELLAQLPTNFRKEVGGGWSFLQACENSEGELWTGVHQTIDKLIVLGLATGNVEFLLPRKFWPALPGGVPYFALNGLTAPEAV